MPNYYFKEIWTPLKLFRISFFRDDEDRVWIKFGKKPRRLLRREEAKKSDGEVV
ncbi:hypothetical protein SAMN04487895_108236 [Paenibacillus sophorae]|uniref:Uncharacterized protein n=1 Tax=Paenibacillus sophorae TaxID=1333845 RepID=A0A1H8QHF1_9BACL|nr:hypothetical protein SAMN04487895_108236 [Paenibacillus sophorae]